MKKKLALALVFALTMGVFAGCSKPAEEAATGNFTDGVYEGVGEGFKGNIKVSVTVENGNIKTIDLLEIEDTPGIGDEGAKEVITKIIEKQSTEVEVKSGATVSSNGTMEAVAVALGLKEAKVAEQPPVEEKEEEKKEEEEVEEEEKKEEEVKEEEKKEEPKKEEPKKEEPKKEEPKKEEPKKEEPKAADGFKDGTYVGKAEGFYGNIEMKVTISGGKISDVTINKMDETEGIGDVAVKKIAENAVAKNTGDLDTVSGATVSSTGAITAIKNALSQAK